MIVGFTGTQKGMTDSQWKAVKILVKHLRPKEVHHGQCIGADAQFHDLMYVISRKTEIHVHPGRDATKRVLVDADVYHDEADYMVRNQDIVDVADVLIAAPRGDEQTRSGTWSTVRKARVKGIPIYIVYPYIAMITCQTVVEL